MWNKLLEKLEVLFEPQIDSSQFVSHYSPSVEYKNRKEQINYIFSIDEETLLGEQVTKNSYELTISVKLDYKSNKSYHFNITTSNVKFRLDKRLKQQEKLLEDLSDLTGDVSVTVNENGIIESFDYSELNKKWETLKPQLLKKHKGKQVESYIKGIDNRVKNETLFLERLNDFRLYGLLFDGLQTLHKKSNPRKRKVSRLLHVFPVIFTERVNSVEDKLEERHFSLEGSMPDFKQEAKGRINEYLNYFDIGGTFPYLSYYKKDVILDINNGFLKSSNLQLELSNGKGYTRRQSFQLKQSNNG